MSNVSLTTSLSLLECFRQPNPGTAWARFVKLYTPLLYSWARRQGLHHDDAVDLTQEVFVKLLGELPAFTRKPEGSFRSWLFRVTVNQCIDFHRRGKRHPENGADEVIAACGVDDPAFAEVEEDEYRRFVVHRALDMIRPEFTPAIWERFERVMVRGESIGEVAHALGISENAVYVAKSRVLTRLRQEIDGLLE